MRKYLVKIGFDNGNAESGPIVNTCTEIIDAESEHDATNKIDNKYGYGRNKSYCGCSVKLATDEEIKEYKEEMRVQEEEYNYLVQAGIIDPDSEKEIAEQYEQDELRRDHLLELADKAGFYKWLINKDDEVLTDTRDMSDEEVIKYMNEYTN